MSDNFTVLESYKGHNIGIDFLGYVFIENWAVCMGNKNDLKTAITASKRKITSLIKKGLL